MNPVYIINPDNSIRDALKILLESEDISAQVFADAKTFLNAVELPVGCILAEAEMPGINGLGLLSELRKTRSQAAIVILVSDDDPDYIRRALGAGAAATLLKPFSNDDLIDQLTPFLNHEFWPTPMPAVEHKSNS